MEFNELIHSFAARHGIADLPIDNGTAVLEIDDMTVGFVHQPASESVVVVAEIGYPESDLSSDLASAMMKANYLFAGTAGAVLCQNPESGAYALMREYRLAEHDPKTFEGALEALVNSADDWKRVLAAMNDPDAAEDGGNGEADSAAAEEVPSMPAGGFLRV